MQIITKTLNFPTRGNSHTVDVTGKVQDVLEESGLREGTCTVFAGGSTAGVTTIEFEPGLLKDLPVALDRIAPNGHAYFHDAAWGDGNGHAHVRSAIMGTSLSVPFQDGRLLLGTWQQIVIMDFDNRPRDRRIVVQAMGN